MRVIILEFLDTDIFDVSNKDCISFLDPLIARWDIDLSTFDMEITPNEGLVPGELKKFAIRICPFSCKGFLIHAELYWPLGNSRGASPCD